MAGAAGLAVISIRSLIYPRGQILDIGMQFCCIDHHQGRLYEGPGPLDTQPYRVITSISYLYREKLYYKIICVSGARSNDVYCITSRNVTISVLA